MLSMLSFFFFFFSSRRRHTICALLTGVQTCALPIFIISPLKAATPPATEIARRAAYDRLPRVKITDLLLEVDAWTGFSECFIHRRSGREADDRNALLTVILADGINLGLTRMAETCRGASLRQLAHLHDWHISEAAYGEALGRLIDAHRAMPLAALWGDGTTSSSDVQHLHARGQLGREHP